MSTTQTASAAIAAAGMGPVVPLSILLSAGLDRATVADLVDAGELREGVCGYWLPEPPDPGALRCMRRAVAGEFPEED